MSMDVFQQVFFLSLISKAVDDLAGSQTSLQALLTYRVNHNLPYIGDWSVVWGPVVWKNNPEDTLTGPANSWYIAYNPRFTFDDGSIHPTYVVAISGAAGEKSAYASLGQSLAVDSVADFNRWVEDGISKPPEVVKPEDVTTDGTYVAIGAIKSVHNLLTYAAPAGTASAGSSLLHFLSKTEEVGKARVVFTGHSLGGALSPTLALALVRSGILPPAQGPGAGVLTYPSAGTSPGNRHFANLSASTLAARRSPGSEGGYQVWNLNLVNVLDIVPQAWCHLPLESPAQNLDNIPTLYGKPAIQAVELVVSWIKECVASSGIIYVPLQSHLLTGTHASAPPATVEEFLNLASSHHISFYTNLFSKQAPRTAEPSAEEAVLLEGLKEKTENEKLLKYPVIGNLEWMDERPEELKSVIYAEKTSSPTAAPALDFSEIGSGD